MSNSLSLRQAASWSWTAATPTRWSSPALVRISGGTSLALPGTPLNSDYHLKNMSCKPVFTGVFSAPFLRQRELRTPDTGSSFELWIVSF